MRVIGLQVVELLNAKWCFISEFIYSPLGTHLKELV